MRKGEVRGKLTVPLEKDRIGVLVGKKGKIKKRIEETLNVKLMVESVEGNVDIYPRENGSSPSDLIKAQNVVKAISLGFSPQKSLALANDLYYLDVIDLDDIARTDNDLKRIKGRIIGERGKTRRTIEEFSGAILSIGRKHVAIIGDYDQVRVAREAIIKLIKGRQHKTVYNYLEREHRRLKKKPPKLWMDY